MTVAVIIPALDEERSIARVLGEIPRAGDGFRVSEVVVVDNGSRDATAEIARRAGARVVAEPRRGYGRACLAGIAALAECAAQPPPPTSSSLSSRPPDVVVFLDADGSDAPAEMPRLLARIAAGDDLVIGSRVLGDAEPGALAAHARLGNRLACALLRILLGARFTDLGPFRAIRYGALLSLGMSDTSYGWTVEMQARAVRERLRYSEVPVAYRRRVGRSKITGTVRGSVGAGAKILWTIFRHAMLPPGLPASGAHVRARDGRSPDAAADLRAHSDPHR
jgi:glycosyltransferase involved in cell wall biosynthesis